MKIEKIDKNLDIRSQTLSASLRTYKIPDEHFALYGISYEERSKSFVRMDTEIAQSVSEAVGVLARRLSGGRVCFTTNANCIRLTSTYEDFCRMPHMALTGSSGFSLLQQTENGEKFVANLAPIYTDEGGFTANAVLKGEGMRSYILYFPLYNEVNSLSLSFNEDATVLPYHPYRALAPILYYGSSITQGGCASRPDNAYQALISKRNKIDFINLGFSGSARAESLLIKYMGGINCSLFVCDYDHNAPTVEYLQATHYALYETYRSLQPNVPILFISKPDIQLDENGIKRDKIIRSTYQRARKQGDNNVYFLSGKSFYANKDCWNFSVEGCHPTDYGFAVMAEKIYKKICKIDNKFAGE